MKEMRESFEIRSRCQKNVVNKIRDDPPFVGDRGHQTFEFYYLEIRLSFLDFTLLGDSMFC